MVQAAFCLCGLPEVDLLASSHNTQYLHYCMLETPLPLRVLGLNAFNHPWMFQVSYVFPPPALVPLVLSMFLAEHVKGQLRHLFLVTPCWMLDGSSLASHSSQNGGRHSLALSHHKQSHCGCFSRPHAQGSAISAYNPLAAQRCVLCRQGFSSSVCQAVAGATGSFMMKVYQQCWKEWPG